MAEFESAYALSREALHELVWSAPMVQLARRFGLSDQGLRKICINQQVPLPKAGYWAKIAAGYTPPRSVLQPFSEKRAKTHFAQRQEQRLATKKMKVAEWQQPALTLDPKPVQWHPVLRPLRETLKARVKEMEFAKSVYDWEQARPGKLYPGKGKGLWFHGDWRSMCNRGQIVIDSHNVTVLRVSLASYERALHLLNAFARKASEQGFQLEMEEYSRSLLISRYQQKACVRVSEKMMATKELQESWGSKRLTQVLVPTGRLSFIVERGCSYIVVDETGRYLEQAIDDFVEKIGEMMRANVKAATEAAQRQKEHDERARLERERLAVLAKERERLEQLAAEEAARRKALIDEAIRWREASLLREYLSALDSRASIADLIAPEYSQWREWASKVADEMDPREFRVCGQ